MASAPAVYGLGWCLRFVTPGHRFAQSADQWFYANFRSLGGGLWVWLTIGFTGLLVIASRTMAPAVVGKPLSSLTTSQVATCLREFADQLATRGGSCGVIGCKSGAGRAGRLDGTD